MNAGTGRFIVAFAPGQDPKGDLHRFAGVAPGALAAAGDGHAIEDSLGVLAPELGVGVVKLAPDAPAKLQAAGTLRVQPERFFSLSRRFQPKPVVAEQPVAPAIARAAPLAAGAHLQEPSWGLTAIGVGPNGPTGKGVRVAILDSGVWVDHPDFRARAGSITRTSFVAGIAHADDDIGHGTFCAGILAGPITPAHGPRYGVAPDVDLFVGRVLDAQERAREFDVIRGIGWALQNGCRIISLSVGALPDAIPDAHYDAIADVAARHNCLIVAAVGNDSVRTQIKRPVRVPANSNEIMAVAAVDKADIATNESNSGQHPNNGGEVDIAAPGSEIYSSCAPARIPYATEGGTSAATPFVAGVAAQLLQIAPDLTARTLWAKLRQTARMAANPAAEGRGPADIGAGVVQAPASRH